MAQYMHSIILTYAMQRDGGIASCWLTHYELFHATAEIERLLRWLFDTFKPGGARKGEIWGVCGKAK